MSSLTVTCYAVFSDNLGRSALLVEWTQTRSGSGGEEKWGQVGKVERGETAVGING